MTDRAVIADVTETPEAHLRPRVILFQDRRFDDVARPDHDSTLLHRALHHAAARRHEDEPADENQRGFAEDRHDELSGASADCVKPPIGFRRGGHFAFLRSRHPPDASFRRIRIEAAEELNLPRFSVEFRGIAPLPPHSLTANLREYSTAGQGWHARC